MVNPKTSLDSLRSRYGELLSLGELAEVLKYPSLSAIRKAKSRGMLPVQLVKMTGRPGFYAKVEDVSQYLDSARYSYFPEDERMPVKIKPKE